MFVLSEGLPPHGLHCRFFSSETIAIMSCKGLEAFYVCRIRLYGRTGKLREGTIQINLLRGKDKNEVPAIRNLIFFQSLTFDIR
jgi:hypothetical protein